MIDDYRFLRCEDGIYFARPLKDGTISSDARKISDGEIIQLFSEVLQAYCLTQRKPLVIERNGKPFIEARLVIE